ncbi:MAG: hypothetical protein ACTHNL_05430 [Devosia sp.]|jgi:DNA-binding NarL/FixJ family response regulator
MTSAGIRQPAIVLVDDDFHSARLMLRMLAAHDAPLVDWLGGDPEKALESVLELTVQPLMTRLMVLVDLKSSSTASRDFIERLLHAAPDLLVVAMAPSLDRDTRNRLLDAGAAAVFERHAELNSYRSEAANIVSFWVRAQRLDAVGT